MIKLKNISIKANYVLIKPEKDIEQLKSGLLIGSDKKTEARNYDITGEILAIPNSLIFRGDLANELRKRTNGNFTDDDIKVLQNIINGSMEYETSIEVKPGDKVWFDYLAHINANTDQKVVKVDGYGECILVEYSRLVIREREGIKKPINGWVFIKKILEEPITSGGILKSANDNLVRKNRAEIVLLGEPIEQYLSAMHSDNFFSKVRAGQQVIYNEAIATPIEYSLHETEGLEQLFKIRRTNIRAIITDHELIFNSDPNTNFRVNRI